MPDLTPPIGRIVDTSRQPCGYSPGDTDATDCGTPATWHIAWDADLENGLACEPHMDMIRQRWVYVDRHPVGPVCGMPGSTWLFDEKRCVIEGLDDQPAAAVEGRCHKHAAERIKR